MALARIQDLEVMKSEELIERLENNFNLTIPIREFKKPTDSDVKKILTHILAHPGFNNELINFNVKSDSNMSAILLTEMVREGLRLAEIAEPDHVICLKDIYNMASKLTVFRKIVMVLTNFAIHVAETINHINNYEVELQKQTESQEKLYSDVCELEQKLKDDKEDLEDLKTEFSDVPNKIMKLEAEKENLIMESKENENALIKVDEELKKVIEDNKPILVRKEQLEQDLQQKLSEICEDNTLQNMIKDTEKKIEEYLENIKTHEENIKQAKLNNNENEADIQTIEICVGNLNTLKLNKNQEEKLNREISQHQADSDRVVHETEDYQAKIEESNEEQAKLKKSLNEDKRNSLLQNKLEDFDKELETHNNEMAKIDTELNDGNEVLQGYAKKIKFLVEKIDDMEKRKEDQLKNQAKMLVTSELEECMKVIRELGGKYNGVRFIDESLVKKVFKMKIKELNEIF